MIERLMSVRRELKQEKARQEFSEALKGFQSEVKPIAMDCVVKNKDGTVRYRYASLKQIMKEIQPLLHKWGLTVSFDTIPSGQNTLTIKCILTHTSGHSETREFTIPVDTSQHMSDIQRWGSTLKYAKRYALVSTMNLIAEEDIDGIEVKNEQENKKEDIKIKKITILDDGTVIEKKEEKVKEAEVKKDKEKEEENVVD
ncbi:MAG: ERF family protein, partial [Endomicrobiia bacterium]